VRSLAVALLVASLALVAAGCGGNGETSSAEEWADDFCSAVVDWRSELERIGNDLTDTGSLSEDRIRELAGEADTATRDLIDTVRGLGAPDTESGDEVEQSVNEFADTVDAEREEIEEAVDEIEGIVDIGDAIATVGTSLGAMATALGEVLATFGGAEVDEEIRTAFSESEACDQLQAG
jgi:hypothetical protein